MKVLIIPDGFKDSLSASQVASAISSGVKAVNPKAVTFELMASDGGDGFLNVVSHYKPGLEKVESQTTDPLGRAIQAHYLKDKTTKTAYLELTAASGIELLTKAERRVMETSTFGTGTLLKHAIDHGAQQVFIGLGGSATNDAAIGIAAAMGWEFLDIDGKNLKPCGGSLNLIKSIHQPKDWPPDVKVVAINDVQNPLYGPQGAAETYSRQKGASELQVQLLDSGLRHLDLLVQNQLGKDHGKIPGTGAAGGTAYGLKTFFNAEFKPGTPFMLELAGFYEILERNQIDLIITGEGSIDSQTKHGKLISGIVAAAKDFGVPVAAICGLNKLDEVEIQDLGLLAVKQLYAPDQPEGYSFTHATELVVNRTKEILNLL